VSQTLPLADRHILITRTKAGSSELANALRLAGATVVSVPTIELVPPDSYTALDEALHQLEKFEWVVFTSAHAVEVFATRRNPAIPPRNVAVIGPATGRAVEKLGIKVTLLPPKYVAESLAESLVSYVAGVPVLLIRAAEARDVFPQIITRAGAKLTIVEAYRNRVPEDSIPVLREMFAAPEHHPDLITFTSASTARNLVELLHAAEVVLPQTILLASIGPITSQAMRELGLTPTIEAREATLSSLTQAICNYFREQRTNSCAGLDSAG